MIKCFSAPKIHHIRNRCLENMDNFARHMKLQTMTDNERLGRIVDFCRLIDKEKFIQRRTYLTDGKRLENDAEHAWHMAVMALLLSEYSNEPIDLLKVVSIVLIHDLVEIYAGDTFAYDTEGLKTQKERENAAAEKLFSALPEDLAVRFRSLWDEFEAWETPEARFAHSLDNFQPLMLQAATDGLSWAKEGRTFSQVLKRNSRSSEGSKALWDYSLDNFIRPQIKKGHLAEDIRTRRAELKDIQELNSLFKSTVLTVNAQNYTADEVADWASCGDISGHWEELFSHLHFIAATDCKGGIIGFSAVSREGYLHSLFVHKDWQSKGIGTLLLSEIEKAAIAYGARQITSDVSITARPFFEKHGYTMTKEQKAKANRLHLTNYRMEKTI